MSKENNKEDQSTNGAEIIYDISGHFPPNQLKRGRTEYRGMIFHYKDGTSEIIKPHPDVKKAVEDMINEEE